MLLFVVVISEILVVTFINILPLFLMMQMWDSYEMNCSGAGDPKDKASLAAISRRPRSSSSGHTPENFRRSKISLSFTQE